MFLLHVSDDPREGQAFLSLRQSAPGKEPMRCANMFAEHVLDSPDVRNRAGGRLRKPLVLL